jgi:hypothetical protein
MPCSTIARNCWPTCPMETSMREAPRRAAFADLQQVEVQRAGDRRVRQFAPQHGLQQLQPALAGHLLRRRHAAARARVQALRHLALLRDPLLQPIHGVHAFTFPE